MFRTFKITFSGDQVGGGQRAPLQAKSEFLEINYDLKNSNSVNVIASIIYSKTHANILLQ